MNSSFPCPNPACSHVFPSTAVQGSETLTCPRCRTVFKFRAGQKVGEKPPAKQGIAPASPVKEVEPLPSQPRSKPVNQPTSSISQKVTVAAPATPQSAQGPAPPVFQGVPVAAPGEPPDMVFDASPGKIVPLHRRRGLKARPLWKGALSAAFGFVLVGCVAFALYKVYRWYRANPVEGPGKNPQEHVSSQFNYHFNFPPAPWVEDKDLLGRVKANLVMRRPNPPTYLALTVMDYGKRLPRTPEASEEAVRRLGSYFTEFEWEPGGAGQLAGESAQRLTFTGKVNDTPMSGECYVMVSKGIAYFLTTWAPADVIDQVSGEFEDLRQRLSLGSDRKDWKPDQPLVQTFPVVNGTYQLQDTQGVWKKDEKIDLKVVDPAADLYLLGVDKAEPQAADKRATALVLLLKPKPDLKAAVEKAQAHLLEQQKVIYPATTVEVLTKEEGKDLPEPILKVPGQVVKLLVKNTDAHKRFVLMAVISDPAGVVAIPCECDLKRRQGWEAEFEQLLSTFTRTKPE